MRLERDPLGVLALPDDAYYGIQTLRVVRNFPVTGRLVRSELIFSYAAIKKAAALSNRELGILDRERGEVIVAAADEILAGKLTDQFPVDIFQAEAGTSFNMNLKEVIANRALELFGRRRGEYEYLSPNDHVNLSQSTNDTFPTACHIAIIKDAQVLDRVLLELAASLKQKGESFVSLPKTGRTHLMDAIPVTLGDEFLAYASAISRAAKRIRERGDELLVVAIDGTATVTGANAPRGTGMLSSGTFGRSPASSRPGTASRHSSVGRRWTRSPAPSGSWRWN